MRRPSIKISRAVVIASVFAAATSVRATVQPLAWYRLGDDDPGAVAGGVGDDPTLDHTSNHFDLTRAESPHYSSDVPLNTPTAISNDKLSMQFFNFTGPLDIPLPAPNYYYRTSSVTPSTASFGLECWVKSSPLGQGDPSGYTLIAYNGTPFSNGIGFFQHGKNYVVRVGSYEKILAPASNTTWTHLAFARFNSTNDFFLDGVELPDGSGAAQSMPTFTGGAFYVGGFGNPMSASPLPPRYLFNGLVDEARFFGLSSTTTPPTTDLLISAIPRDLKWNGSSTWNATSTNWLNPDSSLTNWRNIAPDNADFGTTAAGGNVTVSSPVTVGQITFDAAAPAYTLSGSSININATFGQGIAANRSATINSSVSLVNDQDWNVAASQTLTVNAPVTGMALSKSGTGALSLSSIDNDSITINAGTLALQPNAAAQRTGGISVASGAKLDLTNNRMLVQGGDAGTWNGSAYTGISGLVASGRNGGNWNGSGIVTSMSDAGPSRGLTTLAAAKADDVGYVGKTVAGHVVSSGDAIVMYTYTGDANLDGKINADDYFQIDSHLNKSANSAKSYFNGDFNYDGKINGDDYFLIDNAFAGQGAPFSGGGGVSGVSAVPEPLGLAFLPAMALLLRRRKRAM